MSEHSGVDCLSKKKTSQAVLLNAWLILFKKRHTHIDLVPTFGEWEHLPLK